MRHSFSLALFVAFLLAATVAPAQPYNNGWIDYSKTYYKFKVGTFGVDFEGVPVKKGVVRITGATLSAAGLGSVPVEQLQLWRDGQEVAFYSSKATGVLSASDYIEFWGSAADGKPDNPLYQYPSYQSSNYWSLETDSASYFITKNNAANKRLVTQANNVGAATIQPEKNFTYTIGKYYREQLNPGYGPKAGPVNLYSSSYGAGEGFTSYLSGGGMSWQSPMLYADQSSSQTMTARFNLIGDALNTRSVKLYVNSTTIATQPLNNFALQNLTVPGISLSALVNDSSLFFFQDITSGDDDNFLVSQIEMDYPRKFNFGGQAAFEFSLPASDTGRYLKIANFSTNGVAPVLYDMANGKRYVANTDVADTLRFLLAPSTQAYSLVLVRGDGSTAVSIPALQTRKFTNYALAASQGNYLIVTNPVLLGSGASNYIQQYSAYRASAAGGGFTVKVVDITDLEDQFAFGIKMHPLAIKNFLSYARTNFSVQPAYAFLIGKGLEYNAYRMNETDVLVQQTGLLPTFGAPGSDNLLSSDGYDPVPVTPIGRLSAVTPTEIGAYLAKIKQYEKAQQDTTQTISNKGWMKNVLELTGVNDAALGVQLDQYMANYKAIISDTSFGADVTTYSKSANPAQYPEQVANFTNTFNRGSALVNYFGHSSSTDLDFSLDNPSSYNNTGKYPVFIVNGCLAGNIFDYDAARLTNLTTISEKFVLAPQKGAIGYLSTSSYGIVSYLDGYTTQFYKSIGSRQYGQGFGIVVKDAIAAAMNIFGPSDFYGRIHAEQYTFHGDPALKINAFAKPDYALQATDVTKNPSFISVADDSFSIKIKITNLGKATNDSVHFSLTRKMANGRTAVIYTKEFASLKMVDSIMANIAIVPDRDNGVINFTAYIDDSNKIDELNEANNILQIPVTISTADIRPVFPYNYSVVNTATVTLAASTAKPLDTLKKYVIQVDTTSLFNSAMKTSYQVSSVGGVIEKSISLSLDNTVYFWRVSVLNSGHWNVFSFIHRSTGAAGFEQSHFYQHTQSSFNNIIADSAARRLNFGKTVLNLFVKQGVYPYAGQEDADYSVAVNGTFVAQSACVGTSVIFNVFDPLTFKIYQNTDNPNGSGGNCKPIAMADFEFSVADPVSRDSAVSFLDNFVHDGDYVVARSIDVPDDKAPQWEADTALYGHNHSLYHRLKEQGINIDAYTFPRSYIFIFKKNDSANFKPVTVYSDGLYDAIYSSQNINVSDTVGSIVSPKFGPGKAWSKVTWQGADINANNKTAIDVVGIDTTNTAAVLYTMDKALGTKDISAIDAKKYPYVQLQLRTEDSLTAQPYQLKDWAVNYTPVPEGAVAPNIGVYLPDTVNYAHSPNTKPDTLQGYVVFKNVSVSSFDSVKVKLVLYDSTGKAYTFPVHRTRPLAPGDTANVWFSVNVTALDTGRYNFYLIANADNDQKEQYLFNNSIYKYVVITRHKITPTHLLSFTGQPDGKSVLLNWKASNEINFGYYGVEHSADAIRFEALGNVPGKNGDISVVKDYSYLHVSPVIGQNYYRLKMVDKDGRFVYSNTIQVDFGSAGLKVYPNPFTTSLTVAGVGRNVVKVVDVSGKVVLQQQFTGGSLVLDVSRLAAGTYMVQVNGSNAPQTFKVQKQNN